MALHSQRQFSRRYAVAIIPDLDQFAATLLDIDLEFVGAGVQRIFHQFLNHGRRPLNNFTGGDLVNEVGGKPANISLI